MSALEHQQSEVAAPEPAAAHEVSSHGGGGASNSAAASRATSARSERSSGPEGGAGEAIASKGAGSALPAAAESQFGSAYGTDLSDVRVHTDSKSAAAADSAGAEAFTYGKDVFFGSGKYNPSSEHGSFVLGHELAHVAQQKDSAPKVQNKLTDDPETGHSGDAQEHEASHAANVALDGGSVSLGSAPAKIRFFSQGDGSRNRGGHAYMTEQALQGMGISNAPGAGGAPSDMRQARMGNWERDLSQAITPTTSAAIQGIMPVLNVLAIKEFGRGINIASFGTYDPVEHLDNPANLRGSDVIQQGPMVSSNGPMNNAGANPDTAASVRGDHAPGTTGGSAGTSHQAYSDIDPRYTGGGAAGQPGWNGHQQRGQVINPTDANAYHVDESGIPRYMYASKQWLTQTLRTSGRLGRQQNTQGDEHLHGPRLFASGTHTLQDYFAHSNFCEIGVNILIRSGTLHVRNEQGQDQAVDRSRVLNTQVHANDAQGNPQAGNLAIGNPNRAGAAGAPGQQGNREVLTTGTFNLTDTAASILEEVNDKWKLLDPFKEKPDQPSPLIMAALDYVDMNPENPTDFSHVAASVADIIHTIAGSVSSLSQVGARVVEGAGQMGSDLTRGAGNAGGDALHGIGGAADWMSQHTGGGRVSRFFGGAAQQANNAGNSVQGAGNNAANTIQGATGDGAAVIRQFIAQLTALETATRGNQHTLRDAYKWLHAHGPLTLLKEAARQIPVIGERAAALVESAQNRIRTLVEGVFATAWNAVLAVGVRAINAAIAKIRSQTNVQNKKAPLPTPGGGIGGFIQGIQNKVAETFGNVSEFYDPATGRPRAAGNGQTNGIAPGTYSPPSHTEIAKDHGELHNSAGTNEHEHKHEGEQRNHGEGEHTHAGGWLSGLAQALASIATRGVGVPVNACWDKADRQGTLAENDPLLPAIDAAVDTYFQHPQDCSFWQSVIQSQLSGDLGPELIEHLQSASAGAPDTPSHIPQIPPQQGQNGQPGQNGQRPPG
ncbi:MAG: DUF4157 domain-containing protein [Myxococcales bacterium]|nr:DUF4157 domain-containing protein [Myxococcales bacterium]